MKIEVLYFEGCPHYRPLLTELRELLRELNVDDEVHLRCVNSSADALRLRFLGSPTLRIDGSDVEPGAELREDFGIQCRLYDSGERGYLTGPPRNLVRTALAQAGRRKGTRRG